MSLYVNALQLDLRFVAPLTLLPLLFQVGWYVTLHIIDVPSSVMESVHSGRPLMLVSLLPHEQKVCFVVLTCLESLCV